LFVLPHEKMDTLGWECNCSCSYLEEKVEELKKDIKILQEKNTNIENKMNVMKEKIEKIKVEKNKD